MPLIETIGKHKLLWFALAFALRLGLVSYGLWQDSNCAFPLLGLFPPSLS